MSDKKHNQVNMTDAEFKEFQAYRAEKARKEAELRRKQLREDYPRMVDEEIEAAMPELRSVSEDIKTIKGRVIENFRAVIGIKRELLEMKEQEMPRSHTFTNSAGDKKITLGNYVTDGYRDTVEEGIAKVREYIESLASDEKSKALVGMVMRLLSRDSKGTLKASRIVQLRKIADETGAPEFMEGVRIIEESYQPAVSKTFVRAEYKDENGIWRPVPLGMTES